MKYSLASALLILTLLFSSIYAKADMYRWVGKDGVVHFSDIAPITNEEVETINTPTDQEPTDQEPANQEPGPTPAPPAPENTPPPPKQEQPPELKVPEAGNTKMEESVAVEIFTTSWCGYCKKAKAFLQSNGIVYQEYDIEKDKQAAARMRELGGTGGVPFAIINGQKIMGFSAITYKRALGLP